MTFDFEDLENGKVASPIHPRFDLPRPTHEYDFYWAAVQGNDLYVVVTDTSTVYYRYNPQLWRVSLGGLAAPVQMEKKGNGFQNISMAPLAVSADNRYIVFTAGAKSGVCYHGAWPMLLRNADGTANESMAYRRSTPIGSAFWWTRSNGRVPTPS